ncbi:GNAT family N-acetyltransferase [Nostoc sp. NZL]|uniref:GNAT family N-acetyltransferase n=1 Tax=Nostoc sp. NZL TaxID=2650612 RepID=UPI0018C62FA1|nr:GNAT family N-acetyltransferase [Nostoc sp. NZL]
MPQIETARLLLRPYTPQDLDVLAPILSNPAVMRYSPRRSIPKDQVKEVIDVVYYSLARSEWRSDDSLYIL